MKTTILFIFLLTNIVSAETTLTWHDPIAINNSSEIGSLWPAYCVLNNSGLAIANWPDRSGINELLFSAFSTDFGKTWSIPQQLTPSNETYLVDGSATCPPLFPLNQQGRSVLCWTDQSTSSTQFTAKAALFNSSAGWNTTTLSTFSIPFPNTIPAESFLKNAVIGSNNFSVVVWMEYNGSDYDLKSAYNDGTNNSWTTVASAIATNVYAKSRPALGMSPSGEHLFVSWQESAGLFSLKISSFNFSTHLWNPPTTLVTNNQVENSPVAPIVNDSGHAIVAWQEQLSPLNTSLKIGIFNGSNWISHTLDMDSSGNEFKFNPFGISLNANNHATFSWVLNNISLSSGTQKISYFDGSNWSSPPFSFSTNVLLGSGSLLPVSALNELDQIFLLFQENTAILGSFFQMPPSFSGIMPQLLDTSGFALPVVPLTVNNSNALSSCFHLNMDGSISVNTVFCSSGIWTAFPVPGATSPPNPMFFSFPWSVLTDNGAAIVGWGQEGSTNFFVSNGSEGSSSAPLPPSGGSGFQTSTEFLIPTDLINVLSWTPSPTSGVFYKIYRNGTLVGTSTTPSFNDHQQIPKQSATYSITAVGGSGDQSPPLLFVVAP